MEKALKTTIVTTWSEQGAKVYGDMWLQTANIHWPKEWRIVVYADNPIRAKNTEFRPTPNEKVFELREKFNSYFPNDGFSRADGRFPDKPYNFKLDVCRFSWKVFALLDYIETRTDEEEIVVWMDGDVVSIRTPPVDFWEKQLPSRHVAAHLRRPHSYTETGCVVYRLPAATPLISALGRLYRNPSYLLKYDQRHDGYLWDRAVKSSGASVWPMATGIGHIWKSSPLSDYFVHNKGARKGDLRKILESVK